MILLKFKVIVYRFLLLELVINSDYAFKCLPIGGLKKNSIEFIFSTVYIFWRQSYILSKVIYIFKLLFSSTRYLFLTYLAVIGCILTFTLIIAVTC